MASMKICGKGGRGVHFTFDNGKTVSLQIGAGSYSDNHDSFDFTGEKQLPESKTVEIAVFGTDGELEKRWDSGDSVTGYRSIQDALEILSQVSKEA